VAYWDTSALLKLYVAEPDSTYFLELAVDLDEPIVSSAMAATEVLCVLYRKELGRALKPGGAERTYLQFRSDVDAGRVVMIPYGRDVEAEVEKLVEVVFARSPALLLRSLDAVHVGSALSSRSRSVVATDDRLRKVAVTAGLDVLP
jgi:predicted nucleic acid-binding protein